MLVYYMMHLTFHFIIKAVSESLLHKKGEDFKATEEEKSIKLERAQRNLEDITVRVNALAKQN
jgi:hypothetical protein